MDGKVRIVIVDDIEETRVNIRRLLSLSDQLAVVGEAADGFDALRVCRETLPDCVLLDVNMPRMDGFTTAKAVLREMPNVAVVIMSVDNHAIYRQKAMAVGAKAFLLKPFGAEAVLDVLQESRTPRVSV